MDNLCAGANNPEELDAWLNLPVSFIDPVDIAEAATQGSPKTHCKLCKERAAQTIASLSLKNWEGLAQHLPLQPSEHWKGGDAICRTCFNTLRRRQYEARRLRTAAALG